ncbi:DUF72 domain-containing protein [Halofilum ochraceum]|uniref:DUF72 domain-containing protein n=1 Tax=Halofilum ochraceum TaxID=1611323 RepID=UPI0008DA1237|nr:DUF72 domain-containing protein [Halofilum ochraceum]
MIYTGTASWRLLKPIQAQFPGEGTHLARYARRLPAVEVNSSFYRHHRRTQYAKWASEVSEDFRFAVKLPRWLSHDQRLRGHEGLDDFLEEVHGLGDRLGPLLVQLPPSLDFEEEEVGGFLEALREHFDGGVVCEPRHSGWFDGRADELLARFSVSRAAADPPPVAGADEPGGWGGRVYLRLHGRPQRFYSAYTDAFLDQLAGNLPSRAGHAETWCIFNNTASEAGIENALALHGRLTS